jgi:5-methylcytosine-specific restriction endonuclease McrA
MAILSDQPPHDESGLRQCRTCGESFPGTPEYFSRDKKGRDGLLYRCKNCSRKAGQVYKKAHKPEMAAYMRAFEAEHLEERTEYKRRYRVENREAVLEGKKRYREQNREFVAEGKRRYEVENPDKSRMRNHRRRIRILGAGGSFTKNDLIALHVLQEGRCCWCGCELTSPMNAARDPKKTRFTVDHIHPIRRGGTNGWWNLVLACQQCNASHGPKLILSEWQPSAMLEWMEDHLLWATLMEVVWLALRWKRK